MREQIRLTEGWWVSPSTKDAEAAARQGKFNPRKLELANEPDNHPRRIALADTLGASGPLFGWRDLPPKASTVLPPDSAFVPGGEKQETPTRRVPTPFLTYAQRIRVPQSWRGTRVFLTLDKTRYHVTARVNGRRVAQYVGGLEPHRVDITRHVQPGQAALLVITVGDSGTSGHRPFDTHAYTGTRLPTCKEIENNLVHPVNYGGSDRAVGVVTLDAVPAVRTDFVFADPKVSRGVLRYTVALVNDTTKPVRVRVTSVAGKTKTLVDESVMVGARSRRVLVREIAWPDAILWDLDHPHLYDLVTTLRQNGRLVDTHTDRFGFREFTINGHSFYLNGKKIHLHGQSGHTSPDHDARIPLEEKIAILRAWKEQGNVVHLRLHAKPQDKGWVEAADRVGMLITTETALWTTNFHSFDWAGSEEACYRNVRNHFMEALVRRDRNNPSVVIWSLSNEMSPITPFDLANPKMAAMTRIFKRILAETRAEDSSRVIQMSSAMDFIGNLALYNLHYPKNWQAFPDYPHTAYWLDGSFLFPWYGPRRGELPSWSWRKDKPLLFGEFTCVYGPTPDNQACIVGDAAFERADFGSYLVHEKLWPMEIHSYRRLDVSGFCAWSCMCFSSYRETLRTLAQPSVKAHTRALRPLALLDHFHRRRWMGGDEIALPLSIHNDTRDSRRLDALLEIRAGSRVLWTERMPPADYSPAENRSFTSRFRAPLVSAAKRLTFRATLRAEGRVVDRWEKPLELAPRAWGCRLQAGSGIYDPDGSMRALFEARGIRGGRFVEDLTDRRTLGQLKTLWVNFAQGKLHAREWRRVKDSLADFAHRGGCVILDTPPDFTWSDLPIALKNGIGFADGQRLEITYAYRAAPHHPALRGLTDETFSLWGGDHYVAHRCFETPQEGNAIPLLVAGTDRGGLTSTPLLELATGQGAYLVSTLELVSKLAEEPRAAEILAGLLSYRPLRRPKAAPGVSIGRDTLRIYRDVGWAGRTRSVAASLRAPVALVDGDRLALSEHLAALRRALETGATVYLHDLGVDKTRALLEALRLPGAVRSGHAGDREWDTFRWTHPLANGMTNNYLYWIVNKSRVAPWTLAPLHPEPASARILSARGAAAITRRGAVVVYRVGKGTLVVDNLRWQVPGFDEPERPRRYVMTLLTNLGVPLAEGTATRMREEFETEAERRERGHF